MFLFFFLMIRRPPRSTLFPTRRSSDLADLPEPGREGIEPGRLRCEVALVGVGDRKSTRLNSSHPSISYAVFCLKKKNDLEDFMRERYGVRFDWGQVHEGRFFNCECFTC